MGWRQRKLALAVGGAAIVATAAAAQVVSCALPSYEVDPSLDGGSAGTGTAGSGTGGSGTAGHPSGGEGGSDGGPCGLGPKPESCPSGDAGPTMVPVPGGYCIDSTEVTFAQYWAWLDQMMMGDAGYFKEVPCQWNAEIEPDGICTMDVLAQDDEDPVLCVDWCDAYAYCQAQGKRLCGKIGGGSNNPAEFDDPSKSQWHNACTSCDQHEYPYGDGYLSERCNTDNANTEPAEVKSFGDCRTTGEGYGGIYDLSGNVAEWVDACNEKIDENDFCRLRGGDFTSSESASACEAERTANRDYHDPGFGFRCCWEP